jgi:hypothetical protein
MPYRFLLFTGIRNDDDASVLNFSTTMDSSRLILCAYERKVFHVILYTGTLLQAANEKFLIRIWEYN